MLDWLLAINFDNIVYSI